MSRYTVEPHWQQWAVYDLAYVRPSRIAAGPFNWRADAEAAAARLNKPRPAQPRQPRLGDAA